MSADPFLKELVAPASKFGLQRQRQNETSQTRPVRRDIAERIDSGIVLDIALMKSVRRVLEMNGADKAQLVRTVGEMRNRNVIAKSVPPPSKLPRLRSDLKIGLE